jgi:L-rhamnose mutarotase
MKRCGYVVQLRPEAVAEYKRVHEVVWSDVLAMIFECNIRNYTIFLREPESLLFATFDYIGSDLQADMAKLATDPVTQRWWKITDPLQQPLASCESGEIWAEMEEVFHTD